MRGYHRCAPVLAAVIVWAAGGIACCARADDMAPSAAAAAAPAPPGAVPLPPASGTAAGPAANPLPAELKAAERQNRDGQHEAALAAVASYLQARPDDATGRFLRGVILADMGRSQDAIRVFTLLTIDHPELEAPYNNLGVLYAQAGELRLARQSLEQALQADPQDLVALENLGDVYARLALETYQKVLALDAANRAVRSKLSLARSLADKTPSAAAPGSPASSSPASVIPAAGSAASSTPASSTAASNTPASSGGTSSTPATNTPAPGTDTTQTEGRRQE